MSVNELMSSSFPTKRFYWFFAIVLAVGGNSGTFCFENNHNLMLITRSFNFVFSTIRFKMSNHKMKTGGRFAYIHYASLAHCISIKFLILFYDLCVQIKTLWPMCNKEGPSNGISIPFVNVALTGLFSCTPCMLCYCALRRIIAPLREVPVHDCALWSSYREPVRDDKWVGFN